MIAPLSRIIARYIAGGLVTYGLMTPDDAFILEPEFIVIVGGLIGAGAECLYAVAVRKGWTT